MGANIVDKVWKFTDKTTGKEIECSGLRYLVFMLKENIGLSIPRTLMIDILLGGIGEYEVEDEDGRVHEIVIKEGFPTMERYIATNDKLN